LHPGRPEATGWIKALSEGQASAGATTYRKRYDAIGGPPEFVHYKGQELVERAAPGLEAGEWRYDSAAGILYLRLPDDSNPNSQDASDPAPIVGQWRTAGDRVIRLSKGGEGSPPQVLDRNSRSL
jgi:hypothetical protein